MEVEGGVPVTAVLDRLHAELARLGEVLLQPAGVRSELDILDDVEAEAVRFLTKQEPAMHLRRRSTACASNLLGLW